MSRIKMAITDRIPDTPVRGRKYQTKDHNIYPHPSGKGYYVRKVISGEVCYGGYAATLDEARSLRNKFLQEKGLE